MRPPSISADALSDGIASFPGPGNDAAAVNRIALAATLLGMSSGAPSDQVMAIEIQPGKHAGNENATTVSRSCGPVATNCGVIRRSSTLPRWSWVSASLANYKSLLLPLPPPLHLICRHPDRARADSAQQSCSSPNHAVGCRAAASRLEVFRKSPTSRRIFGVLPNLDWVIRL